MPQAICFNCEIDLLGVGKPIEELIKDRFPVFCCQACADTFPDNGTIEFERKLEDLTKRYEVSSHSSTE